MIRKILKNLTQQKRYFSQTGEDVICDFWLDKRMGVYVDIGSNDPINLSNTYLFYRKGWRGVCVEPNPVLATQFSRVRPDDKIFNIGISSSKKTLPFYVINPDTLSTFSSSEKDIFVGSGYNLEKTIEVECISLYDLFKLESLDNVDILSIDTEGTELEILKSNDWRLYRPSMVIVETVSHKPVKKESDLVTTFMTSNKYCLFADTFINSIYVSEEWLHGKQISF